MTDTLVRLAEARREMEAAKEQLAERQAFLEDAPIYHAVVFARDWLRESQEQIARLTTQLRLEALEVYEATGNKKPWPGVQIKMYTVVEFNEVEARNWCLEHADSFLKLDTTSFKKTAENLVGAPVTITREPRISIASDLSQYLSGEIANDSST